MLFIKFLNFILEKWDIFEVARKGEVRASKLSRCWSGLCPAPWRRRWAPFEGRGTPATSPQPREKTAVLETKQAQEQQPTRPHASVCLGLCHPATGGSDKHGFWEAWYQDVVTLWSWRWILAALITGERPEWFSLFVCLWVFVSSCWLWFLFLVLNLFPIIQKCMFIMGIPRWSSG